MSVRGSKNKVIFYIAGICSIIFGLLLYQNASQRLEELEKLYERCHLNEESLSAQLQVNLEYKVRLERSLQQEKSEHSQIKDDMQSKLEEERQARERENVESINKFTALQQKYKFLQSQHEDVNLECSKLRQLQLSELEEKSRLENQLQSLKNELKLVKENKDNDMKLLKEKFSDLENENAALKAEKLKLLGEFNRLEKHKSSGLEIKLPEKLPLNSSVHKVGGDLSNVAQPETEKLNISSTKSSTSANKVEQEFFPSANNMYMNTSTPMINPDAVLSQDKILSAAPVPQPGQVSFSNFLVNENKENVGAKPENLSEQKGNEEIAVQGVLRAPDIMNDFRHVPEIQQYKAKLKQGAERNGSSNNNNNNNNNNNGGEVGDEGEPLVKNSRKESRPWRDGQVEGLPFVRHPAGNDISKNDLYQYQAEYDGKKEEGEDDDDVDPLDYQHVNGKSQQVEKKGNAEAYLKIPLEDKRESVMIQPK